MTLPRLLRAIVGIAIAALLWAVFAVIVIERCEQNIDLNDITWDELVAAQSAQSNDGGGK